MKAFTLIPLLFLPASWAIPTSDFQTVLGEVGDLSGGVLSGIAKGIEHVVEDALRSGQETVEQWMQEGKDFVKQNGIVCKYFLHCEVDNLS